MKLNICHSCLRIVTKETKISKLVCTMLCSYLTVLWLALKLLLRLDVLLCAFYHLKSYGWSEPVTSNNYRFTSAIRFWMVESTLLVVILCFKAAILPPCVKSDEAREWQESEKKPEVMLWARANGGGRDEFGLPVIRSVRKFGNKLSHGLVYSVCPFQLLTTAVGFSTQSCPFVWPLRK